MVKKTPKFKYFPTCVNVEPASGSCGVDQEDDDHDSDENEDYDAQADNLEALRKSAGLPELPDDGLPSASAQKMMKLNVKLVQDNFNKYLDQNRDDVFNVICI